MAPGIWQILLVLVIVLILFGGRGKISAIMGDFARGITSFRKGLKDNEENEGEGDSGSASSSGEIPSSDSASTGSAAREEETRRS
ncbi:twin-arginine translocase TatA/TatE family subunit [Hyphobacterium marinum]|uniref:Sec-independent protein translocase protein TatA n=1 Tax=Hyphobacterium marinum TaxID=3116574 RepID=A0ABU7M1D2_9PROT|nr:twin-arginine translocase TatA/TatE family subunit [Hyphobacterium sp. Y6023]MEE2567623.1 twin-arginine translocase TatA/TatE family subunit [Hyphobacterium sp. Y6023]